MNRVLVPFDFSEQSVSALRFAVDVCKEAKSDLHLLHVIELPMLNDSILMPVLSFEQQLLDELRAEAVKKFAKIADKYRDELLIRTSVEFGKIVRTIVDFIGREDIDLVVMGTKGSGGLQEMLIGSNTEKVVRRSPVPVIAVKNYVRPASISNIVFANDFESEDQLELVSKVKALQSFFKATLHLVRINTPMNFASDVETGEKMRNFARRFQLRDYTINIFNHQNEESGILHFANLVKGDLIAIGTHGRTGLAHLLSGSLAEDVVNHVGYPVWTYGIHAES